VQVAKNGMEAINAIKKSDYNLIICDVRMPDIDGIETINKLREILKETGRESIPEVIITGYADLDKYEQGLNLEVNAFLYKPFDNEEVLKVIEENIRA
jgi:YesN/AraC family two-component response regulator